MPRQRFDIRTFGKGMIPSVDTTDVDRDSAYWCKDVDLTSREGQLIGLPGDENKSSTIGAVGDAQGHEWIEKTDGKRTLVYYNNTDSDIKYLEDFYGTPGTITSLATPSGTGYYASFVRRHQSLRYNKYLGGTARATPAWVGYTDATPFGAAAITTPVHKAQECSMDDNSATSGNFYVRRINAGTYDASGYFSTNYYYKIALEYDGYQLSILETNAYDDSYSSDGNYFPAATDGPYSSLSVIIRAVNGASSPSSVNPRITGVYLFRAESASNLTSPTTSYRYVTHKKLTDASWSTSGNHKEITITDTGNEGPTYEALSGLAETATASILDWNIACAADNFMFIGDCVSTDIDDAEYMIFRSVQGRFDVYDFQSANPAFLKLPIKPTAMCYFFGKLMVFDRNNTFIINPETLSIEQQIEGYGCLHPQSLCVTEGGVFFADLNGVNFYDARTIKRITQAIFEYATSVAYDPGGSLTTVTDHSYRTLAAAVNSTTNRIHLSYHARLNMLIVSGTLSSITVAYGYVLDKNAWTLLGPPLTGSGGVAHSWIIGKDSEVYIAFRAASTNYLYKAMSDYSSRKLFTWISQRLSFAGGGDDEYAKVYYLYVSESITNVKLYGINDGTLNVVATSTPAITSANRRCKSFRFMLDCASANGYISNVSIIYRELVGLR